MDKIHGIGQAAKFSHGGHCLGDAKVVRCLGRVSTSHAVFAPAGFHFQKISSATSFPMPACYKTNDRFATVYPYVVSLLWS
jgi:hypothetical protein